MEDRSQKSGARRKASHGDTEARIQRRSSRLSIRMVPRNIWENGLQLPLAADGRFPDERLR